MKNNTVITIDLCEAFMREFIWSQVYRMVTWQGLGKEQLQWQIREGKSGGLLINIGFTRDEK